ncbi:MAG: HAD hydrolase-like protein [Candidatus Moraniibacteriota bacterium]
MRQIDPETTLFIISSNKEEILHTYFQNNNFTHIFKEILGAETHRSKVAKFEYLFEKYALKAQDCIFVTDTLGDILEGKKAGVKVIAVDFGFHKRDRLEKGEPFKIVSSFDEILEVIENI